jgi:hypothetical protein
MPEQGSTAWRDRRKQGVAKKPRNHDEPWGAGEVRKLRALAKGNTPTGLIAYRLGRTEDAVRAKASEKHISLKPTNQSSYNRRRGK